ncbi:hypothetical protein Golax_011848, partial [Gossypium laxum]|nr:hypothetical protein [Gossypium laxum]
RGTKKQQRNKEPAPAEEQITSRETKNQHQQRNKESAEEQRTSDGRRDESKEPELCVAKKVKEQPKSTFWLKKLKISAFSSGQKHFKEVKNSLPNEV